MVALYVTVTYVPQRMPAIDPGTTDISTEVTFNGTGLVVGVGFGVGVGGTVVMIAFGFEPPESGPPALWRMELNSIAILPTRATRKTAAASIPSRCMSVVLRLCVARLLTRAG